MASFETVIGIEIHVQMNTKSKMFCSCDNDSFNKEPNINTCPICMGFPGVLPVLNKETVEKGLKTAIALNCEIPELSKFDRKNYFYPDLPKGYQISQYDRPISKNGHVEVRLSDQSTKSIRINRLHLEEDAGKLTHVANSTLCDFNRCGTPLMEIVTEPDIRTIEEASAYAREIQRTVRAIGSSDADMEKGMMRFDINISLRHHGETKLANYKVEVKNLNSFRSLEKALAFEINRQTKMLERGEEIIQETRGFDDQDGTTFSQRTKEESQDYRYFPEPDLPPLVAKPEDVEKIKKTLPELPFQQEKRFIDKLGLKLEDAQLLCSDQAVAELFEKTVQSTQEVKTTLSLITTILLNLLNEDKKPFDENPITVDKLSELVKTVKNGQISYNSAKQVLPEMYKTGKSAKEIIQEKGLVQISDTGELEKLCKEAIENNPENVSDFKKGKQQAIGPLVGYIIKQSKGNANPKVVNELLRKLINE